MEKPKRKRRSQKREQIISTAERLFFRHGAKRVSVEHCSSASDGCMELQFGLVLLNGLWIFNNSKNLTLHKILITSILIYNRKLVF